ncbi:hypothetical protein [Halosimplex halophilum]|uniref:hypothetical protein n=1 Tax=Halosimplex halophilum TaxID=2559572 RepID=UPI00107FD283|nr:hypothetical protein [Halosimplex halophilum]
MTPPDRTTTLLCVCLLLSALVAAYPFGIDAERRALDAEEAYLSAGFENAPCVESWEVYSPVVEEESSVVNQTAHEVYVEVKHPYSYGTESDEVDGASEAVYRVTAESETRVSGDEVVPC